MNFAINVHAGGGKTQTTYTAGTIDLYIGNPAKPDVIASTHEFFHNLGLDDRYHSFAIANGSRVTEGGVVARAPMALAPGVDDQYNQNRTTNMMSAPSGTGGGQLTQVQFSIVFSGMQVEVRDKALIYTTTAGLTASIAGASKFVLNYNGWNRVTFDKGVPTLEPTSVSNNLDRYFQYNPSNSSIPLISTYPGNRSQLLWNFNPDANNKKKDLNPYPNQKQILKDVN